MKKVGLNKLPEDRPQPTYREMDAESEEDLDSRALFQAQPTDDIPRNKLVEKLARGLQSYVQRM